MWAVAIALLLPNLCACRVASFFHVYSTFRLRNHPPTFGLELIPLLKMLSAGLRERESSAIPRFPHRLPLVYKLNF